MSLLLGLQCFVNGEELKGLYVKAIDGIFQKMQRSPMIGDLVKAHRLKPDLDLSTCLLELVVFIKL